MKISRKPTRPRPTAPSRPSRLVTADTALAHGKISGMGLGGPERLDAVAAKLIAYGVALFQQNRTSVLIRYGWRSVGPH